MADDERPTEPPAPTGGRGRKGRGEAAAALAARIAGLGGGAPAPAKKATSSPRKRPAAKGGPNRPASPAEAPTGQSAGNPRRPAKKAPAPAKRAEAPESMPAEQPAVRALYSARITFTTTEEQRRALEMAKLEDRIDKTARLRAMVALWEQDERLRKRVDKLARTME